MSSVSDFMNGYFKEKETDRFLINESTPIRPERNTWDVVDSPERLIKRFQFQDRSRLADFVQEVMRYENRVSHHSMIRIDHLTVDIETYTHDLNRITNIDREFAKVADLIYEDIGHYVYEKKYNSTIV